MIVPASSEISFWQTLHKYLFIYFPLVNIYFALNIYFELLRGIKTRYLLTERLRCLQLWGHFNGVFPIKIFERRVLHHWKWVSLCNIIFMCDFVIYLFLKLRYCSISFFPLRNIYYSNSKEIKNLVGKYLNCFKLLSINTPWIFFCLKEALKLFDRLFEKERALSIINIKI